MKNKMSLNNAKSAIFRPWDEEVRDGELSSADEERVHSSSNINMNNNNNNKHNNNNNNNYIRVNVKCERSEDDDEEISGQSLLSTSSVSRSVSLSGSSNANEADEEELDSLHKLSSLVEKTILRIPPTDNNSNSVDSSSSCSDASFSAPNLSQIEDDINSQRSAFVPAASSARLNKSTNYGFIPGVSSSFHHHHHHRQHYEPTGAGAGLIHQEILARQEHHAAVFDHFAAQQGQLALEEAARLLQYEAIAKQNKKLRPKKFRCPHCDVAFSNNGQLKGHIRIHTGERPFKCDEEGCGKTFTRNEELTRHKRIHSGVRPHACQSCGKRFGRKDHLKKHARTHEMRGPAIYIPAPGPFPFPSPHPPLHPFIFSL